MIDDLCIMVTFHGGPLDSYTVVIPNSTRIVVPVQIDNAMGLGQYVYERTEQHDDAGAIIFE